MILPPRKTEDFIISNNLLLLDTAWYNTVGFVLCQDTLTHEYKCYTHKLGGDDNDNYTEIQDIQKIMMHGSGFPLEAANGIFKIDLTKNWLQDHPEIFL